MLSSLEQVKAALLTVTSTDVYHYEAYQKPDRYIVWAEDSEYSEHLADDYKIGQTIEGTIDLFTKTEDDSFISDIPNALNREHIWFFLNSVQYEDETRYIHYEWLFRVKQEWSDGDVEVSGA